MLLIFHTSLLFLKSLSAYWNFVWPEQRLPLWKKVFHDFFSLAVSLSIHGFFSYLQITPAEKLLALTTGFTIFIENCELPFRWLSNVEFIRAKSYFRVKESLEFMAECKKYFSRARAGDCGSSHVVWFFTIFHDKHYINIRKWILCRTEFLMF